MAKYRKKPVVIEAIQYHEDTPGPVFDFVPDKFLRGVLSDKPGDAKARLGIKTSEGTMIVNDGDYIIKGVNDEFYPCKPDIFEKTYELVGQSLSNGGHVEIPLINPTITIHFTEPNGEVRTSITTGVGGLYKTLMDLINGCEGVSAKFKS